jgi:hypothetical protein
MTVGLSVAQEAMPQDCVLGKCESVPPRYVWSIYFSTVPEDAEKLFRGRPCFIGKKKRGYERFEALGRLLASSFE